MIITDITEKLIQKTIDEGGKAFAYGDSIKVEIVSASNNTIVFDSNSHPFEVNDKIRFLYEPLFKSPYEEMVDTDGDGIIDKYDLDADGDGVWDDRIPQPPRMISVIVSYKPITPFNVGVDISPLVPSAVNAREWGKALIIAGYYPCYITEEEALLASPLAEPTCHTHNIMGRVYYMPEGVDIWHGDYYNCSPIDPTSVDVSIVEEHHECEPNKPSNVVAVIVNIDNDSIASPTNVRAISDIISEPINVEALSGSIVEPIGVEVNTSPLVPINVSGTLIPTSLPIIPEAVNASIVQAQDPVTAIDLPSTNINAYGGCMVAIPNSGGGGNPNTPKDNYYLFNFQLGLDLDWEEFATNRWELDGSPAGQLSQYLIDYGIDNHELEYSIYQGDSNGTQSNVLNEIVDLSTRVQDGGSGYYVYDQNRGEYPYYFLWGDRHAVQIQVDFDNALLFYGNMTIRSKLDQTDPKYHSLTSFSQSIDNIIISDFNNQHGDYTSCGLDDGGGGGGVDITIGETRVVSNSWENNGNNTIVGEILEVIAYDEIDGVQYQRVAGEFIWSTLEQFEVNTLPYDIGSGGGGTDLSIQDPINVVAEIIGGTDLSIQDPINVVAEIIQGSGGGGVDLWSPSDSTLTKNLWLDSTDSGTIVQSSNIVSQWSDKSGNNNHAIQTNSIKQPTLNSTDGILFDGIDDSFELTSGIESVPLSIYFLAKGDGHFFTHGGNTRFAVNRYSSGKTLYWNNSYGNSISSSISYWHTRYQIFEMRSEGGIGRLYINGVESSASGVSWQNLQIDAIGKAWTGASFQTPFVGHIKEILITSDMTRRETIEGYLAHKHGISEYLPTSHSFKSSAPTA